ncbi:macrophage mannose receptor 1-like [Branchiostoma lanceolatum]|uniref:macrophage mannose receptor 1-like n=1 Tax=Branchiostoma lanceolatum TaxID=7740 RepID=UPI003451E59D
MAPGVPSRRFTRLCWLLVLSGLLGTTTGQESSGSGPCPEGYVLFENICYKAYKEFKTFSQALQRCEDEGGTLAMPKHQSVDAFFTGLIINLSPMTDAWIGLRNEGGTWTWLDGSTVSECGFSDWDESNTDHTVGHCGFIRFTSWYKWVDDPCDGTLRSGFICQIGEGDSNCETIDSCTDHPQGVSSGDTCYYIKDGTYKTYEGAVDVCDADDASLAMPKNAGITFLLMGIIIKTSPSRSTDHWVGIDDLLVEGQGAFPDGLLLESCSFTNWMSGNSGNEIDKNCVVLKTSAWMDWSYIDCGRPTLYICQLGPGDNDGCILPTTIPPTTTAPPTTTVTTTVADPTTPAPVTTPPPETTVGSTAATVPQAPTTTQEDQTTTLPEEGQQGKQEAGVDQGALAGGVAAGVVVAGVGVGVGVAAYKFKWLAKVSPK